MIKINDYEYDTGICLGEGGCGTVYLGYNTKTRDKVAVKLVKNCPVNNDNKKEITILQKLSHENIVKLFTYEVQGNTLYLIMEYCPDGDLQKKISERYNFSEEEIRTFLRQAGGALVYINKQDIIHRDIKPFNILIKKSGNALNYKIADFGIAKLFEGTDKMTFCGTPTYIAPEICNRQPASFNADVFSLGITIDTMLRGNINNSNLKDLLDKMTEHDPKTRIKISQVLEHPFMKG